MKFRAFITLFLIFLVHASIACDCGSSGPFLKTLNSTKLTAIIKVKEYLIEDLHESLPSRNVGFKAELIEVLKGEEDRTEIRIFGDKGNLCRPYSSEFPIGTTWIINLDGGSYQENATLKSSETEDDYAISICGEFYLRIENDSVSGNIIKSGWCHDDIRNPYKWSLSELKERMKSPESYLLPTKSCFYEDTYTLVQEMPEYKYGQDSLNNLIIKKLNIDPKQHNRYTEWVFIEFFVEKNGILTNIKKSDAYYHSKIGEKYDKGLIKILEETKADWLPGKHFNENLRVHIIYEFDLLEICKKKNQG